MTTRYVNTASSPGGDGTTNATSGATRAFASLNEAEAAMPATLTDWWRIVCEGSAADTTAVTFAGTTTSAANYIEVWTDPAATYGRHDGKWNTAKYRITAGITISENHVRISGLQSTVSGVRNVIVYNMAGAGVIHISNCWFSATTICVDVISVGAVVVTMWNTICSNAGGSSTGTIVLNQDAATFNCYNVTAYNRDAGTYFLWRRLAGTMNLINCLGVGRGQAVFTGTMNAVTYCASDDATADDWGGAGNRITQTFTFVDSANGDFHLAATDAGARDYGVTDPGSGLFSDDIDGVARSGSGSSRAR